MHRVTDVSEEGLWVQTDLLLEVGSEVTLTLHPPDSEEPLHVAGRVRRVVLRPRPSDTNAVGMGIEFEAMRAEDRRRLNRSMRGLRAQESFILDQRTLTGVPVGVGDLFHPSQLSGGTVTGWSIPPVMDRAGWRSAAPRANASEPHSTTATPNRAFGGGLDLATSAFTSCESD